MTVEWYCTQGCKAGSDCKGRSEFDGTCVYEYDAKLYSPKDRWDGEGPPPHRWKAGDGTMVYRTFADYCD